jgi:hypothetical protein
MKLNLLLLPVSVAALFNAATAQESPVELLSAGNFAILAKTGISTVPDSAITGDIAVSPIDSTAMTGFSFAKDLGEDYSTSVQIAGKAYAADYTAPIPSLLTTAVSAMEAAYTNAAGRTNTDAAKKNLGGGLLGGAFGGATTPLTTGVYTFGTDISVSSDIHFSGSATDVFIIQTTGNLVQAANINVILEGGALAKNIFWQVAGFVKVGAGAHLEGVVLVKTHAVFMTGSSLDGRILSQTACTLDQVRVTEPL